eukprot:TRINITY_DN7098_c6_g1_i1.p1 TRINITY_DN7098_c6_g1~~TRINITY_DN7098_c6_g1_i1.p1  ORF type:complete len:484 (+),score=133.76 TRINITY_DN7098_c6_g1_i1:59-1453(+)
MAFQDNSLTGMEDTPEARMDRIRELLLNNRPKQVVLANVKSPQQKVAERLGLAQHPKAAAHTPPPQQQQQPLSQQPNQPPQTPDASEANIKAMMMSLKVQNDHLRAALHRTTQEITSLRAGAFLSLQSDQFKDRRFIEEQEQHYWDYIKVEHAVGEREETWKNIVRDIEAKRVEEVQKKVPVLSPPVVAFTPQPQQVDGGVKRIVAELRDELTMLRRQYNNDKALHNKERDLWKQEREDLLAALKMHKQSSNKRSTSSGATPTATSRQYHPKDTYPQVSEIEKQLRAREKKRARMDNMREKENFMARVAFGKLENTERSGLEVQEDDERNNLIVRRTSQKPAAVVAARSDIEEVLKLLRNGISSGAISKTALQGVVEGSTIPPAYDARYDLLFAHQREAHENFEGLVPTEQAPQHLPSLPSTAAGTPATTPKEANLNSLLTTQLQELAVQNSDLALDGFDTDIL